MWTDLATRALRRYLVGPGQEFVLRPATERPLPPLDSVALYLHLPFCRHLCPYCPYNRVPYDRELVGPYVRALSAEIAAYQRRVGRLRVTSLYIGGGTPTHLLVELGDLLDQLREQFVLAGEVCLEVHPHDATDRVLDRLVDYGVQRVSLGVQSFQDRYLQAIGRDYPASLLPGALARTVARPFETVNLDLIFAQPEQTPDDLREDLETAVASGANQVTAYPLLTFPYSEVGRFRRLNRVQMPGLRARRRFYRTLHATFAAAGWECCSVWGFRRPGAPGYSSVTRDCYLGFGAGAASCVPGRLTMNTFPVPSYIAAVAEGRLPVALALELTPELSDCVWLYWQLYGTRVSGTGLAEMRSPERPRRQLLALMRRLGWCRPEGDDWVLTEPGAFWLHLLQNHLMLNYISRVWTEARTNPWPQAIAL